MAEASQGRRGRSAFFLALAGALSATALFGFARSFYLQPLFGAPPLTALLVAHGVAATAWFALLIAQAVLARRGQIGLHRTVGQWGWLVAIAVAASALAIIVATATDGEETRSGLPESVGMFIQLGSVSWFSVLALLAWRNTRRPDYHKRLIAMATIVMMAPVFSRISRLFRDGGPPPFDSAFAASLFIAALAWNDWRTLGKLHPVTLLAGGGYLAFVAVRMPIARSDIWNHTIVPALTGG
jgi:hypothetical protein